MKVKYLFLKYIAMIAIGVCIWFLPLSLYMTFIEPDGNSMRNDLKICIYSLGYQDGAINALTTRDKELFNLTKQQDSIKFILKYCK